MALDLQLLWIHSKFGDWFSGAIAQSFLVQSIILGGLILCKFMMNPDHVVDS